MRAGIENSFFCLLLHVLCITFYNQYEQQIYDSDTNAAATDDGDGDCDDDDVMFACAVRN